MFPILVVGPGRCGSSTIARLLHTRLGVNMGEGFKDGDLTNPRGFFEDLRLKEADQRVLGGAITVEEWATEVKKVSEGKRGSWGFKDPRISCLARKYTRLFPKARYLRCVRPSMQVAQSISHHYKVELSVALDITNHRETMLDLHLPASRVYDIDMSWMREEESLMKELSDKLMEI